MSPHALMLLLCLLPPTETDLPASPLANQVLRDTAFLLELWPLDGSAWGEFAHELVWVQRHQRETYGAPSLADSGRLPSSHTIDAYLEANLQFANWLNWQHGIADWLWLEQTIAETSHLAEWWMWAKTARDETMAPVYRRQSLKAMRDADPGAYYAGNHPPWIPVHRFRTIR